jgi:hypothetical protein
LIYLRRCWILLEILELSDESLMYDSPEFSSFSIPLLRLFVSEAIADGSELRAGA